MEIQGEISDYCCFPQSQENISSLTYIFRSSLSRFIFFSSLFFFFFFILFLTQTHLLVDLNIQHIWLLLFWLEPSRTISMLLIYYQPQWKPCASSGLLQIIYLCTTAFCNPHYHHPPGTPGTESTSIGLNIRGIVILTYEKDQYDF